MSESSTEPQPEVITLCVDESVSLRTPVKDDLADLWQVIEANQSDIKHWFARARYHESFEALEETHQQWMTRYDAKAGPWTLMIVKENQPIGCVWHAHFDRMMGVADVGYWLDHRQRGHGIATRAVAHFIDASFNQLDLHKVTIRASPQNQASIQIAKRLNFTHEGTLREEWLLSDGRHDGQYFGMLRKEWTNLP